MTEKLEKWLASERWWWSQLITDDDGTPDAFEDLARRSEPFVSSKFFLPMWLATSAFTPSAERPEGLPSDLVAEWIAYGDRWAAFLELNPIVRLATIMSEISESQEGSSWPYGWEDRIRNWVRFGFDGDRPFSDGWHLDTPEWRQRLAETASAAGEGWIYERNERLVWIDDQKPRMTPEHECRLRKIVAGYRMPE